MIKQILLDEFETLAGFLNQGTQYFMFRDFQSRNIIVKDGKLCFIDYQGGMKGALQYDVASLLWQAKAELSNDWKDRLFTDYMNEADKLLPEPLDGNYSSHNTMAMYCFACCRCLVRMASEVCSNAKRIS